MGPRAQLGAGLFLVLLLGCILPSCEPARSTPTVLLVPSLLPLTVAPSPIPPSPTRTPPPTVTSLPPAVTSPPTATPLCRFEPQGTFSPTETLHDVVVYVDAAGQPQLMQMSADGQWQGPDAVGAEVIPECRPAGSGLHSGLWDNCRNWQLSPAGQWLAFNWGGEDGCSYSPLEIAAVNLLTGERRSRGGGEISQRWIGWFRMLPDGRVVLAYGFHCVGGRVWLWDLQTDQERELGSGGETYWNTAGTILAVNEVEFMYGRWSSLWGYNGLADRMLFAPGQGVAHPVWTPDDSGLVYEDRLLTYTRYITPAADIAAYPVSCTLGPRQILFLDVEQGGGRVVAGDPGHNYFLGASAADCRWEGDWVQVRRFPFYAREFPAGEFGGLIRKSDWTCDAYGEGCPDPPDLLALNWRTGELLPWDQVPTSSPSPALVPTPGPDLDRGPLYADPAGRYNLFVGLAGRGLWCVPAAGPPVQWVPDGQHFVYIP